MRAKKVMHGKPARFTITALACLRIPSPFTATRYHGLVVDPTTLPDYLEVTAWTEDEQGEQEAIMGLRHRHDIEGVQFHPESILSEHGHAILTVFWHDAPDTITTPMMTLQQALDW